MTVKNKARSHGYVMDISWHMKNGRHIFHDCFIPSKYTLSLPKNGTRINRLQIAPFRNTLRFNTVERRNRTIIVKRMETMAHLAKTVARYAETKPRKS
ncbi:MAG: hypothetical protein IJU43_01735 [Lachnospiraceae bacterium]|nr:hypothetical protein [Lachnospiraceae bacterium]